MIDGISQNLRVSQESIHHLEMERLKASKSSPLKQDIDKCMVAIESLRKEEAELTARSCKMTISWKLCKTVLIVNGRYWKMNFSFRNSN